MLKLTDLNANHFYSFYYVTIKQKPELRLTLWIFGFFIFYLYGITEHGNSFQKSIISSYELSYDSFFRYVILELEKLKQPVTKHIETTFNQCWWVWKLHRDHAADKLLTQNIDIRERRGVLMKLSSRFLRKNPNKLCFIKLSQNFYDWL